LQFACIANKFDVFLSHNADDTQLYGALSKKSVNDAVTTHQKSEVALLSTTQHARASPSLQTDVA